MGDIQTAEFTVFEYGDLKLDLCVFQATDEEYEEKHTCNLLFLYGNLLLIPYRTCLLPKKIRYELEKLISDATGLHPDELSGRDNMYHAFYIFPFDHIGKPIRALFGQIEVIPRLLTGGTRDDTSSFRNGFLKRIDEIRERRGLKSRRGRQDNPDFS